MKDRLQTRQQLQRHHCLSRFRPQQWVCLESWFLPSWVSPPRGLDQESSSPTTCDSTVGRGYLSASSRTAQPSHHRPRPHRRSFSPSTTHPRSAAWGCHATYLPTSAHSCDSFPWVDHMHQPGQPRPFAPQPTAIRGQITATTGESASVPATVLSSSRILPLGVLPLTPGNPELYRFRLHTFRTRARAGLMLPVRRTPPGQYTGIPQAHPKTNRRPWFRSHLNIFRRVNGRGLTSIAHLPGPHLTRSQPRLFPRRSARQSLANAPRGGFTGVRLGKACPLIAGGR